MRRRDDLIRSRTDVLASDRSRTAYIDYGNIGMIKILKNDDFFLVHPNHSFKAIHIGRFASDPVQPWLGPGVRNTVQNVPSADTLPITFGVSPTSSGGFNTSLMHIEMNCQVRMTFGLGWGWVHFGRR